MSLVSSGSDRLSLANVLRRTQYATCTASIPISVLPEQSFAEVMDSAVLGGVVEIVSSNPARVKNVFQHLPA